MSRMEASKCNRKCNQRMPKGRVAIAARPFVSPVQAAAEGTGFELGGVAPNTHSTCSSGGSAGAVGVLTCGGVFGAGLSGQPRTEANETGKETNLPGFW